MTRHTLILFAVLLSLWLLLSGHSTALLIALGALSAAAATILYVRVQPVSQLARLFARPGAMLGYIGWLSVEIIKSNIAVLHAILAPARIAPRFFVINTVDLDNLNPLATVIYANSITLTPGTVSTELADGQLVVHGLLPESESTLAEGAMRRRVQALATPPT